MSTHFQHMRSDAIFGIRYTFDHPGDGLPRHQHAGWDDHDITVECGSVRFETVGSAVTLTAGITFRLNCELQHIVTALEPGTVIFNTFLAGMPESYQALPPEELVGSFNVKDFGRG